ncbi:LacI family DNA-binding transcriptional regulator [Aestuariivirga litoralis]|uniref:LacI family DNA-binding transcriptional regulator n=1 Tax=Aestuariivirga litoralis TaxID=2650924 RepID=UPI0018C730DD|nr:LacI family DNA-binding transcriptional regulator [Aestuariivirga litoralis]MBG1232302.1 LacI family transcriptional regulator [Aestuariivirga litoralis]
MRPTTRDIAKAAGVSLATVDRVLNGRPRVSRAAVDAVNKAIDKLGFVRNLSAANLAKGKVYRFQFLLPKAGDQFLETVITHVEEARAAFRMEHIEISCRRNIETDPHQISQLLSTINGDKVDGIALMAPESPQVRDAITRLRERDVQVVLFVSGQPGVNDLDFVGLDNSAAGATAGRLMGRFCGGRAGEILVVTETMKARDSLERRHGFDLVITRDYPHLKTLPSIETYGDAERTKMVIKGAYANHPSIIGAYILSSEARLSLEAIAHAPHPQKQVLIAHERTTFSEQLLVEGQLDAVIAQNPGHLVRSAIRVLRARCDNRLPIASQEEIRIEILLSENLGLRAKDNG